MALMTDGWCLGARLLLTLSSKYLLMSGGGLDRSTTSLSSEMSCPKNRLRSSLCRSNFGGSRFSPRNPWTMDGSAELIDNRVLLLIRLVGLRFGFVRGVGVGFVATDDLRGKVLEVVEWTSQVRPSKVVLDCLDMFKLDMDRYCCWWSLMDDWLLGLRGGRLGAEASLELAAKVGVLGLCGLFKVALDKVAYKDFIESRKLGLGSPPFVALEVSLKTTKLTLKSLDFQKSYLNDIALLRRPARSWSRSDRMMSPVDLLSSLEAFRSRLTSL